MKLGLSLSAPSGTLQQAFIEMRQGHLERSNTLDPPAVEQEPGTVPSTEAALRPNSNIILVPQESLASTTSTAFPAVSLSSTATSSPPPSTGRVSPPPVSTQTQTQACVTSDTSPAPQSSHEIPSSQHPPAAHSPPSSSTFSPPSVQTSISAVPGPQLSSNSVSSVVSVKPSCTSTASEKQPFNSAVTSSQPMSSSSHASIPISTQQQPPPNSLPSQSQVQPQPVESEGAELQTKIAGRDDIQALDKKLRSLFKDQSSASSSTSVDPNQNTGTSSPPTGTSSPPPGAALAPPSNLPLNSGVQSVVGPTTTPGQGITPAGHAQTPPSKPRAQVSGTCSTQE